jgi:rubrerythrin
MSKTTDNLKAAFAGESQANHKYLAYARQAEKEGFIEVAELFRKRAAEEATHAMVHLEKLGAVASTKENLEAAVAGESGEAAEMYPEFARAAREEGNEEIAKYFDALAEIENHHSETFFMALKKLEGKHPKWKCDVCGYVHEGDEPPEHCPRCGADKSHFHLIDE